MCCFGVVVFCLPTTTQNQHKTTQTRSKQTNTQKTKHTKKHKMQLFAICSLCVSAMFTHGVVLIIFVFHNLATPPELVFVLSLFFLCAFCIVLLASMLMCCCVVVSCCCRFAFLFF